MIKANPYYHWVQSGRRERPSYPKVKAERGTRATNREARNGRKHNVSR
jgi:hypothetical protein